MKIVQILGGLGNQMFQYAFYKSLKYKNNEEDIKIDLSEFIDYDLHNGFELNDFFELSHYEVAETNEVEKCSDKKMIFLNRVKRKVLGRKRTHYKEKEYTFKDKLYFKDYVYLEGYWQSELYFENLSEEIRKEFTFKVEFNEKNNEIKKKIKNNNSVSVHIRRGDYLNHKDLGDVCNLDYYKRAIDFIKSKIENPIFFIFSNDIEWCKENLKEKNMYFVDWNKGKKSYLDMYLMTKTKHNIIANSSFSWWGAWLNKNKDKIVIAPKYWFKDKRKSSIVPENWMKI